MKAMTRRPLTHHSKITIFCALASAILVWNPALAQEKRDKEDTELVYRERARPKSDARVALMTPGYTLGVKYHGGSGAYTGRKFSASPTLVGYSIRERNGLITGLAAALSLFGLTVVSASMPTDVSTQSNTYTTYNDRGQKIIVTEERTTAYYDPEDMAQKQWMLENSTGIAASGFGRRLNFELDIFTRQLEPFSGDSRWTRGDAWGHRVGFLGWFPVGPKWILETGLGFGRMRQLLPDVRENEFDQPTLQDNRFLGTPVRMKYALGPAWATLGWDLNWRAMWDFADGDIIDVDGIGYREHVGALSPMYASVDVVLWRLHLSAGLDFAPLRLLQRGDIGYFTSAGVRF